jgi:hypothetical protein
VPTAETTVSRSPEDRSRFARDDSALEERRVGDYRVLLCGERALAVRLGNGRTLLPLPLAADEDSAFGRRRAQVCSALGAERIEALVTPPRFDAFVDGLTPA